MLENEGAGAGQDDGQGGSGAPSGGSPEGGSESELDEKFEKRIKAALASQRAHYESQLGNVRAEFEAYKAGAGSKEKADDTPKRFTWAQLKAAVDGGQITQEQANDTWAVQVRQEALEAASSAAHDIVDRKATKERIDGDIAEYTRLKPEIMDEGSEVRNRIKEEFKALVDMGMPGEAGKNLSTQLAAIRAVLGPLDKLKNAASARRAQESEEQGGSGGGEPKNKGAGKKLVDHLKGDAKEFYERGIKQGRYKDWSAVEAELKYASPKVRERLGLPA